ncbi:hypothetical protein SAMN06265378_11745 [Paracoccus sediminis]|uniref:Uncharacterized protein n=1 Tax=Paracoccus sediminis TaxID=1214787 RepID=A0A238YEW7_9RHOB|nr:hypothetical protein SAMN06265378_11745 [Paracoccus sediminis]
MIRYPIPHPAFCRLPRDHIRGLRPRRPDM